MDKDINSIKVVLTEKKKVVDIAVELFFKVKEKKLEL